MCYDGAGSVKWADDGSGYTVEQCAYRFENPSSTYNGIKVADGTNRYLNH